MAPRVSKRPSAQTRVRKLDKDLLSSQFSQSETLSQSNTKRIIQRTPQKARATPRTPQRRTKALKSLVKEHQSIFSPKKKDDVEEYVSSEADSKSEESQDDESGNESVIEIESDSFEEPKQRLELSKPGKITNKAVKPLTTYTVPLNTKKWIPLPEPIHSELSALLQLLSPPTMDKNDLEYRKRLETDVIRPLATKFSTICLPPVHKYLPKKAIRQRGSGDFNLNMLHQDQKRLLSSYDINSKQLDTLTLQLIKEKEMLSTERKYLNQLKDKLHRWKQSKEKRIDRLRDTLGNSFKNINDSLDSRNSGIDGADDIDMIDDTKTESENEDNEEGKEIDPDDKRVVSLLIKLDEKLSEIDESQSTRGKYDTSLKQLLNQLQC